MNIFYDIFFLFDFVNKICLNFVDILQKLALIICYSNDI